MKIALSQKYSVSQVGKMLSLLDLLVTKEGLKGHVAVCDSLGHNDHRMV